MAVKSILHGLVTWFFLGLSLLGIAQEDRSISEDAARHCPVCHPRPSIAAESSIAQSYHRMHKYWENKDYEALYSQLILLQEDEELQHQDTLHYFVQLVLGRTLNSLSLFEDAGQAYQEALEMGEKLQFSEQSFIRSDWAANTYQQGKPAEALEQFKKLLNLEDLDQEPALQEAVYNGLAICYLEPESEDLDSAQYYLHKNIQLQQELADSNDLIVSYLNLGLVHYLKEEDPLALKYWKRCKQLITATGQREYQAELNFNLSLVEEALNRPQNALDHLRSYVDAQDSAQSESPVWEMAKEQRRLELKIREDEIKILKQEQAIQEKEAARQRSERNLMIALALLSLCIALFLWWMYRATRRNNRIIQQQKENLQHLNSIKNRLFSIVAHDLRGPVQRLERSHKNMIKEVPKEEQTRWSASLKKNHQSIKETHNLLDNLLHWSLQETDGLHIHPEAHKPQRVLEQVLYDFQSILGDKQLTWTNSIPLDVQVEADYNLLRIIFRNLIENAVKFTPERGTIQAYIRPESEPFVGIVVENTGSTIPEEKQGYLFELTPQKRAGKDTAGFQSTGLGLHLCRELLRKCGGSIYVESKEEFGTRFIVCLKKRN
ncbi:hypothetical protein KFE98_17535 [bacterium SCSIO 12741]|nr:hypothetical protein KFE98_17535 [bacterium SCSIO 12741]